MTVINSTRKVRANGDGIVVAFQFSFPAKVATDVVVKKILNSTGVATLQVVSTDYTIVLNTVTEGGTITYVVAPSALEDSFIIRETTQDQQTALPIGGNFPEISVENEIDRSRLIDIEIQEALNRSITLPETESLTGIELPLGDDAADRAGKALVWNTDGDNLTLGDEIGNNTGDWATARAYEVRDLIKDTTTDNIYYCNLAHTSSGTEPITTNVDVAKWDLIVDAAAAVVAKDAAEAAQTAAETAQTAAELAETNAQTAQTAAELAETNAETAETNAETAETNAETAQTAAELALDTFDDIFLGAKAADPTLDNDGDPLATGALYFNTATNDMKVYNGTTWQITSLSADTVVSKTLGTGSAIMPSGTTAQRDGSPVAGYERWNTTENQMEFSDGTNWARMVQSNKNAIINGDFNIWQRGTSFAAAATNTYQADRWTYDNVGVSVHTISRVTDVPTLAESGHLSNFAIKLDVTTIDASVAAGDLSISSQVLEGYNFAPLAQKPMVLSFWHKHTKTGIYCVSFRNTGSDRAFVAEYTQTTTDTWERAEIQILASPSGGTWDYTNGAGLRVGFAQMSGTTFHTTAGAWNTGNFLATVNQVNATDNAANNFLIAQVQLETGSIPTPFEYREIGKEFHMCKRYYEELNNAGLTDWVYSTGQCVSTTSCNTPIHYEVEKRAVPSLTRSAAADFLITSAVGGGLNLTALTFSSLGLLTANAICSVASGLVAGNATRFLEDTTGLSRITIDAEL